MKGLHFAKGHATMNDFICMTDRDGLETLDAERVRRLCDRRAGIGADGILRAVRASNVEGWDGPGELWFMDYRNADGSIAEMCGNGLRLFLRYLVEQGLTDDATHVCVGTRAGLREGWLHLDGDVTVTMGEPVIGTSTWVELDGRRLEATAVDVGNPHAVCVVDDVAGLDLTHAPRYDETVFPHGVNVEFVCIEEPGNVAMRVFERGVGETWSCGTGVVASAAVAGEGEVHVAVRGGTLVCTITPTQALLRGPASIVAHGVVDL